MCPVVFYSACRNRRHLGPRIDRTGAGSWCGVCASSARRPAGAATLRPANHVAVRRLWIGIDRRRGVLLVALATIIGAAAHPSSPKMSPRASSRFSIEPLPGIALPIKFTLAQQPDMRRVTRSRTQTCAASSDMNNVHDSLMNDVHVRSPASSKSTLQSWAQRWTDTATTSKPVNCIKSIYFAHQLRESIRHVKYATD